MPALFTTERLSVAFLDDSHVEALLRVYGDAEAMRWVGDGRPLQRPQCVEWVAVTARNVRERGYGMAALTLKESGETVGFCGLVHPGGQAEVEVKYALDRAYWGRGLASEAVAGLLDWGREARGLAEVIATLAPDNQASVRVLEKNGFVRSGERADDQGPPIWVMTWRPS